MAVKQISIFMENRPGQLLEGMTLFAENNINLKALMIAETANYGITRIITEENERVLKLLKEKGWVASISDVIEVAVPDKSGGLLTLLQVFAEHNISIEYMYSIISGKEDSSKESSAYMIIKVNDVPKAETLLKENGIAIIENS